MIQWPGTLPQMPSRFYSLSPTSGISSPDDEQFQYRNRAYPDQEISIVFDNCSMPHFIILKTFYDSTLNNTGWFNAPWLEKMGFNHHICKISKPPSMSMSGDILKISVNLIIMAVVPVNDLGDIIYGEEY